MPVQKTYTVEILNPTNIESEVPKLQTLRQPLQDVSETKMADNLNKMADIETKMADDGAKIEDGTFVPVFSSKKEEAVLIKGDLKLQKVQRLPNPFYSEINGEVIHTQPIRVPKEDASNGDNGMSDKEDNDIQDNDEETPAEKKPKSRIPKMRLHQAAAEMVKERRKSAGKEQKEEVPTAQPRRSSIPRRRRQSYKSPPPPAKRESDNEKTLNDNITSEHTKKTTDVVSKDVEEAIAPEEFDKLYDEIIHTDESLPFIDTSLQLLPIDNNLEDPVSLENTFEELMHDYEEHKAEPIDVKDIKSKIPLLKQKSLPEGEFIRRIDRRRSLKDIPIDEVKAKDDKKPKLSKLNDLKYKYDRNAKEDLKEHKRLSKEILKREDANKKQSKDVKSKFFKGKCDSNKSNSTKIEVAKNPPVKASETDVVTQKSNENAESVKVATPILKKQENVLENNSKEKILIKNGKNDSQELPIQVKITDEMPNSARIIQNINSKLSHKTFKMETDDGRPLLFENTLPAEKRESIKEENNKPIYKIETNDDLPLLFENTLPVQKREYDSGSTIANVPTNVKESTLKLVNDVNKERQETLEPSIPTLKGKVSKLANIFSSNEPDSSPLPKKEVNNNQVLKKNTILSKIAVFNKDNKNNMYENNSVNKPRKENVISTADNISTINNKEGDNETKEEIEDSYESYETKPVIIATKSFDIHKSEDNHDIQKDLDKPKYDRSESKPLDIPNKFKIHLGTTTPPNTPQISFNSDHTVDNNKETLERFRNASDKLSGGPFENNQPSHEIDPIQHLNQIVKEDKIDNYDNDTKVENNVEFKDNLKSAHYHKATDTDKDIDDKPIILITDEIVFDQDFEAPNQHVDFDDVNNLTLDKNNTYERQPSFEAVNTEFAKEDFDLTGKVSRIINRIDSIEEKVAVPPKKEINVPIKKSVLSRVAMFERQQSHPKPNYKIGTAKPNIEYTKPRIIEEVLKAPPPRSSTNQKDSALTNSDTQNHKGHFDQKVPTTKDSDENVVIQGNIVQETIHYHVKVIDLDSANESSIQEAITTSDDFNKENNGTNQNTEINVDTSAVTKDISYILDNKPPRETLVEREEVEGYISKRTKETAGTIIEDRLKRIQSVNEENNLRKTKSVAEHDLGNTVKGKVHQLIKRMTSVEKLHLEKNSREEAQRMISAKERPKKMSVFAKIALFEVGLDK